METKFKSIIDNLIFKDKNWLKHFFLDAALFENKINKRIGSKSFMKKHKKSFDEFHEKWTDNRKNICIISDNNMVISIPEENKYITILLLGEIYTLNKFTAIIHESKPLKQKHVIFDFKKCKYLHVKYNSKKYELENIPKYWINKMSIYSDFLKHSDKSYIPENFKNNDLTKGNIKTNELISFLEKQNIDWFKFIFTNFNDMNLYFKEKSSTLNNEKILKYETYRDFYKKWCFDGHFLFEKEFSLNIHVKNENRYVLFGYFNEDKYLEINGVFITETNPKFVNNVIFIQEYSEVGPYIIGGGKNYFDISKGIILEIIDDSNNRTKYVESHM